MKTEIPPVIVDPCPLAWDGMKGDDKRRFCEQCQLHVHNLSQMNARERGKLLGGGGHICVTYAVDEKGALIEHARRHWTHRFFSRVRTVTLALTAMFLPLGTSLANRHLMGKLVSPTPSPTPAPTESQDKMIMGDIAPAAPTPTPKLVPPGGVSIPPQRPSPTPQP